MPGFAFAGNFNFLVEIAGLEGESTVVGGFSEVSGISSSSDVIEYRVGSTPLGAKIPGPARFGNLKLRRGVTTSLDLYRWRKNIEEGESDLRSGSIVLLDSAHQERTRWNFYEAWPCSYEAPEFDAQGDGISIETLELCVERIERVDP
ncbi:MAG: phage tail protein [Planctomycetota bacterium]